MGGQAGAAQAGAFQRNNFDLLRLAAALQVMIVHLVDHMFSVGEPLAIQMLRLLPGVPIFFFISGFLVSASWAREPDWRAFARNRALRILPAYWAVLLVSILAIVLVSGIDLLAHWRSALLWIAAQLVLLTWWNPQFLRVYGTGVVNGSLWTIPVEVSFYLAVPLLSWLMTRLRRPDGVLVAAILLSLAAQYALLVAIPLVPSKLLLKALALSPFTGFWMFGAGMLAQRHWQRLAPLVAGRLWLFAALYAALLALQLALPRGLWLFGSSHLMALPNFVLLALVVLSAAYTAPGLAERLLHRNDISYGLYLFHMPIANMLIALGLSGYTGVLAVMVLAIPVAALSWLVIERPALRHRVRPRYRHG